MMRPFPCFTRSTAACLLAFALAAAPSLSGCAAMLSIGNPAAAVKVAEGARLGVVVRRAEAAVETATQVDRLLVVTPIGGKAGWSQKVLLSEAEATAILDDAAKSGVYSHQPADIMPVEVWARLLPKLEAKDGDHPSLLARIDPALAKHYGKIVALHGRYVALREDAARAQDALDKQQDSLSKQGKATQEANIDRLDAAAETAHKAFEDAKGAFVEQARASAAKVAPAVRDETGPVVARLREAVSDANTANGAALVRYPLAVTSLIGDAQVQAGVFLADVVEEKSGKRPDLTGVQPTVTLDGITPQIGLNGLTSKELGTLDLGEVTSETVRRTKEWVGKAMTLMVWAPSTSTTLSYQSDVLDAILDGYEASGWKRPAELDVDSRSPEE